MVFLYSLSVLCTVHYEQNLVKTVINDINEKFLELENFTYKISNDMDIGYNIDSLRRDPFNLMTRIKDQLNSIMCAKLSPNIFFDFINKELQSVELNVKILEERINQIKLLNIHNKKTRLLKLQSVDFSLDKDIREIKSLLDEIMNNKENNIFEITTTARNIFINFLNYSKSNERLGIISAPRDRVRVINYLKCLSYFISMYLRRKLDIQDSLEYNVNENKYSELKTFIDDLNDHELTELVSILIIKEI